MVRPCLRGTSRTPSGRSPRRATPTTRAVRLGLLPRVQTTDPRLERFNNQDLVNAAWAYAKLAARGAQALFAAMRATVKARADADAFTAANITTLVWATRWRETWTLKERTARRRFVRFRVGGRRAAARACVGSSAVELAATAWTFADAGALRSEAHRDLFRALGARVSAILDAPSGLDANDGASFGTRSWITWSGRFPKPATRETCCGA